MLVTNALGDLVSNLVDRRTFRRRPEDGREIKEICEALLCETAELSGRQLATSILSRYAFLDDDQKLRFFEYLNDEMDLDAGVLAEMAKVYGADPSPAKYRSLSAASEPKRQSLFRKLNEAPGATAEIVRLRADLLKRLNDHPDLARTDHDLMHLLRSWFNRGFLAIQQINWDSPASILAKIIAYEAVHEIATWDDLRRRLEPTDRRCFAFFHPSMPDEPLIFVEIALTTAIPTSIQSVLSEDREVITEEDATTAVFYSISNCQKGLSGISFGNSLIKQVARDLSHELPNIKTFVTLSPIPGLTRWIMDQGITQKADDPRHIERLAAKYLLEAKAKDGFPLDPVARFHLGNGAIVHAVHSDADVSKAGMEGSSGAMVNYRYDLSRIAQNKSQYATKRQIASASAVRSLAKRAG